jgi:hypothetical protein
MARTSPTPVVRAARTVIGNLDEDRPAGVDPAGMVTLEGAGWGLEWWIGAEDRWHVPADEPSTRQKLIGSAPVVETRVRVPSGDAVHRAFAARDASGSPVVIVEIENQSKVPFAIALAVRPAGTGSIRQVSAEGTEVRVDGALAVVTARAPGRRVAVTGADAELSEIVFSGAAQPEAAVEAVCRDGRAQAALVFPLAHAASLRVVLPMTGGTVDVDALPTATQVASGWRSHAGRGARIEVPDRRLQEALDSNICHLLLRPHSFGAAAALSRFGFAAEAAATLLGDPTGMALTTAPGEALLALAAHWSLTHDEDFADRAVPLVATLVESLGRSGTPAELRLGAIATAGAAGILASVGQARGAADVRRAGAAMAKASTAPAPPSAPTGIEPILQMLRSASSTWTWVGPHDGHALEVGAALLVAVRGILVVEAPEPERGLQLSPHVPESWYGQGWEVHDLPTARGRLSYAVRWHGDRPAILWDLEPWPDSGPVRLTAPGLDPTWSSEVPKGEALLVPVALPEPAPRKGLTIPVTIEPTSPKRT